MLSSLLTWPKKMFAEHTTLPQLYSRPRLEALEERVVLNHDPIGPPFQVNQSFDGSSSIVANDTDTQGNFIVAWTDVTFGEGTVANIYAQFFDRDGNALLSQDIVVATNVFTRFFGSPNVDVTMGPNGKVAIAYDAIDLQDGSRDVFVQFYDFLGTTPTGTIEIKPDSSNNDDVGQSFDVFAPSIASFVTGSGQTNYVVSYGESDDSDVVKAQFLDSNGSTMGSEINLDTLSLAFGTRPDVASDASGNSIFTTWTTGSFSSSTIVGQQIFTNCTVGNLFTVATLTGVSSNQASIGIAGNGSNGVITYSTGSTVAAVLFDPTQSNPVVQQLSSSVNQSTFDFVSNPDVASAQDGTFTITWVGSNFSGSPETQPDGVGQINGSSTGVFGRIFNPDGTPESPELAVSTNPDNSVGSPVVAIEPSGKNVIFSWDEFLSERQSGQETTDVPGLLDPVRARIYRLNDTTVVTNPNPNPGSSTVTTPFNPFNAATLITLVNSTPSTEQLVRRDSFLLPTPFEQPGIPVLYGFVPFSESSNLLALSGGSDSQPPGRISGRAFLDLNNNGRIDPGEGGLAAQIVFIDRNGNGELDADELTTVTDENGNYYFDPLDLREYSVRLRLRAIDGYFSAPSTGNYKVGLSRKRPISTDKDFAIIERATQPRDNPVSPASGPDESNPDSPSRRNRGPGGGEEANEAPPEQQGPGKPE